MKKLQSPTIVIIIASFLFVTGNVQAQTALPKPWSLSIGLENGIPTGLISEASNVQLGVTARLQYAVSTNFALTLTSGYYDFLGANYRGSMGMIPVKLGFRAFVSKGFYFNGEAGAGFETQNFDTFAGWYTSTPKRTKLILSPGFGYATRSWDFGMRWERFSGNAKNYGVTGVSVAYSFGL